MKDHKHPDASAPLSNPLPEQSPAPTPQPPTPVPKRDMSALYIPGAIVIAALIIAGGLYFGLAGRSGTSAGTNDGQPTARADVKDVNIEGAPFIGKANAPVVMAYWFDYQCPFCKAFDVGGIPQITTTPALPELIKNYVNTGKLKIVFKDYAFLSEDSITAAEYGRAIWDLYPKQFFAWHEAMMKAQDEEHGGFGNAASIDALIRQSFPQMDGAKIKTRLAEKKSEYDAAIRADQQEGSNMGVNGTPGFVVGTTLISGAQGLSAFTSAIDPLLK